MNFEYNEDQLAIKEMAKNFSETEFKHASRQVDSATKAAIKESFSNMPKLDSLTVRFNF